MIKNNYYYLVAGLPDLIFDGRNPGIESSGFKKELKPQLDKADYELVELLFHDSKNQHILDLHFNNESSKNTIPQDTIEPLPYILNFLEWADEQEIPKSKIKHEVKLNSLFFEYLLSTENTFLKEWFNLQLNAKNILTAFNCIQFNHPLNEHLIRVKQNKEIYSLLLNKRLKPKLLENEVPMVNEIFSIAETQNKQEEKEKQLDKLMWKYLEEQTCYHYFTIEKILSFIIKLRITERWSKLDSDTGQKFLHQLINEIKSSYKFSEEFAQ
uniref:DUF2764 family protein n=1 Tax=uncultured Draconibacterium sp. TaxID=1573823 RepID=UPI003217B1C7